MTVHVHLEGSVTATGSLSTALKPADQTRGWKHRWNEVERELGELLTPSTGPLSAASIHAAHYRLHSFFVQTYHLKDALKHEQAATGVHGATIEAAINNEPDLALLADLANLDKHGKLTQRPRSGNAPAIKSLEGSTLNSVNGTWRLSVVIDHAGKTLDGLDFAQSAVSTWRRVLAGWGLL